MCCSLPGLRLLVLQGPGGAGVLCSALAGTEDSAARSQTGQPWDKATATCLQELNLSWVPKEKQLFCHLPAELCHLTMQDKKSSFFSVLRQQNSISNYIAKKSLRSVPLSSKTCCKTNCSMTCQKENHSVFHFMKIENCRLLYKSFLQNSLEIIQSCQSPAVWRI